MFGKFAGANIDLTAATHRAAAADRININTKLPRCRQNQGAMRDPALTTRRGKNDFYICSKNGQFMQMGYTEGENKKTVLKITLFEKP